VRFYLEITPNVPPPLVERVLTLRAVWPGMRAIPVCDDGLTVGRPVDGGALPGDLDVARVTSWPMLRND